MNKMKPDAWFDKNERINANRVLQRGNRIEDPWGDIGIVVKIEPGTDNENHGTIYVWQENRMDYGADNCEHYAEINWHRNLRILE